MTIIGHLETFGLNILISSLQREVLPHAMEKLMVHTSSLILVLFLKKIRVSKHLNQKPQTYGLGRGTIGTLNEHTEVQQSHGHRHSAVVSD